MNQQLGIPRFSRRQKPKKTREAVPSSGQLAERFFELQRLRQKVREAKSGQKVGRREAPISTELA